MTSGMKQATLGQDSVRPMGVDQFVSGIDKNNRWVLLAEEIHWEKLELHYCLHIPYADIHPEVSPRTLIAAYIIKYKLKLSSNATIRFLNENHYLQYFAQTGLHFGAPPITADLMRSMRDRFGKREWSKFRHMMLHESFVTPLGRLFFSLSRRFKKPVFEAAPVVVVSKQELVDKDLFDSLGLEYPAGNTTKSSDKSKRRKAKTVNKRLRKGLDIIVWTVLIVVVISSIVLVVKESQWGKGKKTLENRK